MLRKAILTLLAVTVIGLAATTSASARGGGGGDYLPAVGYPLLFTFSSYHASCHPVRDVCLRAVHQLRARSAGQLRR
jgi:hypothetical protein